MHRVRVWDAPTRVFHWLLFAVVAGLLVTANLGGNWMNWHLRLGYGALGLLLFRLVWGFLGGYWSRFAQFLYGPSALVGYWRGLAPPSHRVGHTPLGALSVFALLAVLAAQVGSGLMSDDAIAFFGPLVRFVSSDSVELATWYHKEVGRFLVIGLVVLHLMAIAYYRLVRRQHLTSAMWTGQKMLDFPAPESADTGRHRLLAAGVAAGCAGVAAWVAQL